MVIVAGKFEMFTFYLQRHAPNAALNNTNRFALVMAFFLKKITLQFSGHSDNNSSTLVVVIPEKNIIHESVPPRYKFVGLACNSKWCSIG